MSGGGPVDNLGDVDRFIKNLTDLILLIAAIVVVGMVIWSGVLFVTSGGSEEKLTKAKGSLTASIVGLLIVLFSAVIIKIFQFLLTGVWL